MHIDSARNNFITALDNGGRFWYCLCNTRLSLFTGRWIFEWSRCWHRMHFMATESANWIDWQSSGFRYLIYKFVWIFNHNFQVNYFHCLISHWYLKFSFSHDCWPLWRCTRVNTSNCRCSRLCICWCYHKRFDYRILHRNTTVSCVWRKFYAY